MQISIESLCFGTFFNSYLFSLFCEGGYSRADVDKYALCTLFNGSFSVSWIYTCPLNTDSFTFPHLIVVPHILLQLLDGANKEEQETSCLDSEKLGNTSVAKYFHRERRQNNDSLLEVATCPKFPAYKLILFEIWTWVPHVVQIQLSWRSNETCSTADGKNNNIMYLRFTWVYLYKTGCKYALEGRNNIYKWGPYILVMKDTWCLLWQKIQSKRKEPVIHIELFVHRLHTLGQSCQKFWLKKHLFLTNQK